MPERLTAAQIREDLAYLRDTWAIADRSFSEASQQSFARKLEQLTAGAKESTLAEFSLEVARLMAIGGNGHSTLGLPRMPLLPIHVWWFEDGLFVVGAHPKHADLVGARVVRIGDSSAEEAQKRIAGFIPGNEEHQRVEAPPLLTNPLALRRAGLIRDSDAVALTVIDRSGKRRKVTMHAQEARIGPDVNTWNVLIPEDASTPERWPHVLDAVARRPAAFSSSTSLAYEWISTAPRVLYLRSNRIDGDEKTRLDMMLLEMTAKELVEEPPQAVIFDLRYNMGGNLYNTIVFSQMLPHLVAPTGKVFVLTGPVTFSAAIATASMLRIHGGDRVVFVGARMGDHDQFWAEGRNLTLPHSKIEVRYSDFFHDWANPCRAETCLWATRIFSPDRPISLQPDVPVATSFGDYARGVDAALERAMELAKRH